MRMGVDFSRKKRTTVRMKLSIFTICHLAQIFACCRKGNAMNVPPNSSKTADFAAFHHKCDLSERIEVVWCSPPFIVLLFFFFSSCSGSSSGCLNKAEFAQIPEDGVNAACCIRCHALPCITWTFVGYMPGFWPTLRFQHVDQVI